MNPYYLSLLLILGLSISKPNQHTLKAVPRTDSTLINLKNKKAAADKFLTSHKKSLIILVKVPGKKKLVQVKNDHWPDEIECTYNILKGTTGKIIFIAEIPFSESGDWSIEYKHYFDEGGKTYAFSKEESIFDDNVPGGIIRETLLRYYDGNFKKINENSGLIDKDSKVIRKNKNDFDFRNYKYNVYKNVSECLTGYNIALQ